MTELRITPPPELLKQWEDDWLDERENVDVLLIQAFQAGADQELEACFDFARKHSWGLVNGPHVAKSIRAARRPNPPTQQSDDRPADY
jgi:hypothetical protein